MIKLGTNFNLSQEELANLLVIDVVHEFEGYLRVGLRVHGQLHLAAAALAECLYYAIVADLLWHFLFE